MTFIQAIVVLVIILCLNLLINRIATVALTFTGMSREMARFQARSAFCTVGFTTTEAESVVSHPVRRRIIMLLMLAGNVGFVSIIVTAVNSFGGDSTVPPIGKLLLLVGVLAGLWAIGSSKWLDDRLFLLISWALKRTTNLDAYDYHALLHLQEGYYVSTIDIDPDDWLIGRSLAELRLADIGINVLGIKRVDGSFIGAPAGGAYIRNKDKLIVYGLRETVQRLDRQSGNRDGWERHQQVLQAKQAHAEASSVSETAMNIMEVTAETGSWLVGQSLESLRMKGKGVAVFGIEHEDGRNLPNPLDGYIVQREDRIFCYGDSERLRAIRATRDLTEYEQTINKIVRKQSRNQANREAGRSPA